ncbi:MAG: MATE family efflux transporter [Spirochaetales bacterium]|nr:MATE family efflux transporter [Spirochaetales bacterium]
MLSKSRVDMINRPIIPSMIAFVVPLILSGFLQLFFSAADTIVVGRFAGHASMAAIGATFSLTNLLVNFFIGLSVGVNVVVAKYFGAGHDRNVEDAVHTAIATSLISGVLLAFVGLVFSPVFLGWMGTPDDVIEKASLYMRIIFIGMPFNMLYNFGAAVLRAYGDTKRPLYYLTVAGAINVFANLFFVIVLKMDVAGVAIATVLSQAISSLLVLIALMRSNDSIKVYLSRLRIRLDMMNEILYIGVPAGLQSILFSIANVTIQSSVNSFGSYAIAGNTAAISLDSFVYITCNSMAQTNLSFMGQNRGAGKYSRIDRVIWSAAILSSLMGLVMGWGMYFAGDFLFGIYSKESEVIRYGMMKASVVLTTYFIFNFEEVMVSAIRGLGNSLLPMVISVVCICGFRLLWIFTVFQFFRDFRVLSCCFPLSWALSAVVMTICFLSYRRKFPKTDIE